MFSINTQFTTFHIFEYLAEFLEWLPRHMLEAKRVNTLTEFPFGRVFIFVSSSALMVS
jgi:hypothetical protein